LAACGAALLIAFAVLTSAAAQADPPTGPVRACPSFRVGPVSFSKIRAHGHNLTCSFTKKTLKGWASFGDYTDTFKFGGPLAGGACIGHGQKTVGGHGSWYCHGFTPNLGCGHDGFTNDYCEHLNEDVTLRFQMRDNRF